MSITPTAPQTTQNINAQNINIQRAAPSASHQTAEAPQARASLLKAKIIGAFHGILEKLFILRPPSANHVLSKTAPPNFSTTTNALGVLDALAAPLTDKASLQKNLSELNMLQDNPPARRANPEAMREATKALEQDGPRALNDFALARVNKRLDGNFFRTLRAEIATQVNAGDNTLKGAGEKLDALERGVKNELSARGYAVAPPHGGSESLKESTSNTALNAPAQRFVSAMQSHATSTAQRGDINVSSTLKPTENLNQLLASVARNTTAAGSPEDAFDNMHFNNDSERPSISVSNNQNQKRQVYDSTLNNPANNPANNPTNNLTTRANANSAQHIAEDINSTLKLTPEIAHRVSELITSTTSNTVFSDLLNSVGRTENVFDLTEARDQSMRLNAQNRHVDVNIKETANGGAEIHVDQTAYLNRAEPEDGENPTYFDAARSFLNANYTISVSPDNPPQIKASPIEVNGSVTLADPTQAAARSAQQS